jgi:anti-sigma regulatory factor (Ser/Thr protein kinase)
VSEGAFSLDVPAEPLNLGTARTFASRVAAHFGCPDDTVLDLKLAVSEACTGWMADGQDARGDERAVRVYVRPDIDHLRVEVRGSGSLAGADPEFEGGGPTRLELIRSLFPDAQVAPSDDGSHAVRFSVPTRG